MKRIAKRAIIVIMWFATCFASFYLGGLGGYAYGTAVSTVAAAASMASDRASNMAMILHAVRDDRKDSAYKWGEAFLQQDLEMYYKFIDSEVYQYDPFKQFSYFEPLVVNDMESVVRYLERHKTTEDILAVEVYKKVVEGSQGNE